MCAGSCAFFEAFSELSYHCEGNIIFQPQGTSKQVFIVYFVILLLKVVKYKK